MSTDAILNQAPSAPPAPTHARDRGTGGLETITPVRETGDTRLVNEVGALRDDATFLKYTVERLHDDVRARALDDRTSAAALRDPRDLLRELSREHGLSWATIARLANVTPTAVRKWRRGETIGSSSRRSLARATTFLRMLDEHSSPIIEVGTWLEMPLSDQSTLTAIDLYVGGRVELLLDYVARSLSAQTVLNAFDPDWRERYPADGRFAVEVAKDGNLSIVEREG
jgi:transcriptional regulator with XRE-family HTH domain